jgi:broad specificity phosphatase PhoE
MSTLTVVRHAQARPFEPDSDRLSEIGETQARVLGEYWSRNGIVFDEVWCGSLDRHRQTAGLALGQALERAGRVSADWNEYDVAGILTWHPQVSWSSANPGVQKAFEVAMLDWLTGPGNGAEPWAAFRDRVLRGLRAIRQGTSNRRVVVFTSGGPIGVLVQTALNAPDRSFLEVNWRVRNCSISEFVFSAERFSLDSFNAIPHLPDARLRTFR